MSSEQKLAKNVFFKKYVIRVVPSIIQHLKTFKIVQYKTLVKDFPMGILQSPFWDFEIKNQFQKKRKKQIGPRGIVGHAGQQSRL
jgi:hypothetical protein